MSDSLVAKRYAKALYDLANSADSLEQTDSDMRVIDETLTGSRDLQAMFQSPVISRPKKETISRMIFGDSISAVTQDFLSLLIGKRRENIFPAIVGAYRDLRDDQLGIVEATAKSASPLSESDQAGLRSSLERITGKKIRLNTEIDTTLIGGVSVKVGDTVFDGSVKHQLQGLRSIFHLHPSTRTN